MRATIGLCALLCVMLAIQACGGGGGSDSGAQPGPTPPSVVIPAENVFVNWEHHPLHAVDISADGASLAVVNTPDNRLELLALSSSSPIPTSNVSVGLDPVSVRWRDNTEAWVVNHISDSISIVDTVQRRVKATVQTCDEPYDVVFAGGSGTGVELRAYVACSQVNKVQVVDVASLATVAQFPIPVVEDPRSMAVSPDRSKVYVGIFESSNATTLLGGSDRRALVPNVVGGNASQFPGPTGEAGNPPNFLCTAGPYGGANPPPNNGSVFTPAINANLPLPPPVGLIVRKSASGQWLDDNAGNWTQFVVNNNPSDLGNPCNSLRAPGWDMPDRDIAVINVADNSIAYATRLMNMVMAVAINPANGNITAVGTDATNEVRFEPNVNGTFVRVKLATVNANTLGATVVDLNPHLSDYSVRTRSQAQRDLSLGDPRGLVWNQLGTKGYITGMGSNNVVAINADGSRASITPIEVGEGPVGLAWDEPRHRLYVLNRFASTLSVINTQTDTVVATLDFLDPTPAAVKVGRKHLYDTHKTSGLGQASCASCHIDARTDRLAWDLGDPGGQMKAVLGTDVSALITGNGTPAVGAHNINAGASQAGFADWHPMKGPMTTQTLQDIIGTEPLHHRGDQDGLEGFNSAFMNLQADDAQLTAQEMNEYKAFLATISYPPNPFRNFDNTLATQVTLPQHVSFGRYQAMGGLPRGAPLPVGNARNGFALYTGIQVGGTVPAATRCVLCHTIPTGMGTLHRFVFDGTPGGVLQTIAPGPNGERHAQMVSSDTNIHRANKIQGWRQLYEKVGLTYTSTLSPAGFGNMSDGREPGVDFRAQARIFNLGSDQNVADFVAMVMSFSGSDMQNPNPVSFNDPPGPPSHDSHAAVGKQVTITNANPVPLSIFAVSIGVADVAGTLPTDALQAMVAIATPNGSRVDLVAKDFSNSRQRGWYFDRTQNLFFADVPTVSMTLPQLRATAKTANAITFTLVPRGSGVRIGIDRNRDGVLDGQ